jgi:hypothetical protein
MPHALSNVFTYLMECRIGYHKVTIANGSRSAATSRNAGVQILIVGF